MQHSNKFYFIQLGFVLFLFVLFVSFVLGLNKASIAAADKEISVLSAETIGLAPIITPQDPRRQLDPRRPALVQILPAVTAPDSVISQQITVYNDEAYTRQVTLTQQLPAAFGVTTLPNNVSWDNMTRQWTWTGQIAGGNLDYKINASDAEIPYLDLAQFGVENLCDQFSTVADEVTTVDCDDETVTLNIGQQGQSILLYGVAWRSLTLHADGYVSFGDSQPVTTPQIMPATQYGLSAAPLHADYDLSYTSTATTTTQIGRWHAAIIADWIDNQDVLYVQWHNAPLANDPNATVRMALAIPLWSDGETPPEAEMAWYVYDNVSHPDRMVQAGYSIGIQDGAGERGVSYAHSVGSDVQAYPPQPSVLQLEPIRYGNAAEAQHTLLLKWRAVGDVPDSVISTVELHSDSQQQPLTYSWDTSVIDVRYLTYLPLMSAP